MDKPSVSNTESGPIRFLYCQLRELVTVQGFLLVQKGNTGCASLPHSELQRCYQSQVKSWEKPLVPFVALVLQRKCFLVVIQLLSLQQPRRGRHCLLPLFCTYRESQHFSLLPPLLLLLLLLILCFLNNELQTDGKGGGDDNSSHGNQTHSTTLKPD